MIEYKDECVGCPPEMGCMGDSCPNRNVPHYYCDRCGEEIDEENLPNMTESIYAETVCVNIILMKKNKI